jgi:hypothetical protein
MVLTHPESTSVSATSLEESSDAKLHAALGSPTLRCVVTYAGLVHRHVVLVETTEEVNSRRGQLGAALLGFRSSLAFGRRPSSLTAS